MATLLSRNPDPVDRPAGIRAGLVDRIQRQLADGTYDIDGKLDIALDRMIDEVM
ncbi:MAG: flagellar biosynthesis anti-sigma factor FlgM [Phycisphaerales bacterium]|nr:flagellar biosynthesis anti-sigma factor FlgM [Phycisphaerales bacterium]